MTPGESSPLPEEDELAPPRRTYRAVSPGARRGLLAGAVAVVAIVVAVAVLGGGGASDAVNASAPAASAGTDASEAAGPQPRDLDARTAQDQIGSGHVGLRVTRPQLLRTRPDPTGQLVAKVGRHTPYGGPTILPIVKAIGNWVAVVSPYRRNNKLAWTKVSGDAKFVEVAYSIAIRVRARTIVVRKRGKVIKRFLAAVGQKTHPTPPGRYAVTDGLIFNTRVRGPYGCCALVLSARQTKLPVGWTGGDRIAIHGTPNKQSIGLAASLGCLRVGDEASRWLVRKIPAGTTVLVRP